MFGVGFFCVVSVVRWQEALQDVPLLLAVSCSLFPCSYLPDQLLHEEMLVQREDQGQMVNCELWASEELWELEGIRDFPNSLQRCSGKSRALLWDVSSFPSVLREGDGSYCPWGFCLSSSKQETQGISFAAQEFNLSPVQRVESWNCVLSGNQRITKSRNHKIPQSQNPRMI